MRDAGKGRLGARHEPAVAQEDWKPWRQCGHTLSEVTKEPTTNCPGLMSRTSPPTSTPPCPQYSYPHVHRRGDRVRAAVGPEVGPADAGGGEPDDGVGGLEDRPGSATSSVADTSPGPWRTVASIGVRLSIIQARAVSASLTCSSQSTVFWAAADLRDGDIWLIAGLRAERAAGLSASSPGANQTTLPGPDFLDPPALALNPPGGRGHEKKISVAAALDGCATPLREPGSKVTCAPPCRGQEDRRR